MGYGLLPRRKSDCTTVTANLHRSRPAFHTPSAATRRLPRFAEKGRTCGHVGCCDQAPGRHATKHDHATRQPIIEGYDPLEGWGAPIEGFPSCASHGVVRGS